MKIVKLTVFHWSFATVFFVPSAAFADVTYDVNVNTSSLAGQNAYIDLQFNPSSLTPQPVADLTLQNFTTDGILIYNPADPNTTPSGNVTGTLPGTLSFNNGTSFNDYSELITFGSFINFEVTFSGPAVGVANPLTGDTFALDFINSAFDAFLLSDDPDGPGYSFVAGMINLGDDGTTIPVPGPSVDGTPNAVSPAVVTFSLVPNNVPDSARSAALLVGGMFCLHGLRRKLA